MAEEATRTDPDLWEKVKDEVTASEKGGKAGQWSARKAQMAVQEYKRRGGGYDDSGASQKETHLHEWTEEDWGTKSGEQSLESGERYLPREVRLLLTEDEYARSTQRKKSAGSQFSDQPDDVREKAATIRKRGPTKKMAEERAAELDIRGRSSMSKEKLIEAIDEATDENGRARGSRTSLETMSRQELVEMARDHDLEGRSRMSKDELVSALAESEGDFEGTSKRELYEMARERGVEGRSRMTRGELERALS